MKFDSNESEIVSIVPIFDTSSLKVSFRLDEIQFIEEKKFWNMNTTNNFRLFYTRAIGDHLINDAFGRQ